MKTWYCVNVGFYDNRKFKACITERQAKMKPKDQHRRVYGMTAFKIWMMSEINAIELLNLINDGTAYIDDLINLMSAHEMDKLYGNRGAVA